MTDAGVEPDVEDVSFLAEARAAAGSTGTPLGKEALLVLFKPEVGTRGGLDLTKVRLIETRLLVHRQSGWVALPYVWNNEQTEAALEVVGDIKSLELVQIRVNVIVQ